jgi:hypothetical protein
MNQMEEATQLSTLQDKTPMSRSKRIQALLGKLKLEDDLFDYNIPPIAQTTFDDESMLAHLRRVYSQTAFVVEEPSEVKKYLSPGDFVLKKGDYFEKTIILKPKSKGVIAKMNDSTAIVTVNGEASEVKLDDLLVTGSSGFFGKEIGSGYIFKASLKQKLVYTLYGQEAINWKVKEGDLVTYEGEEPLVTHPGLAVPEGTLGIVMDIYVGQSEYIGVSWERKKGVNMPITQSTQGTIGYLVNRNFKYAELKLLRKNTVNFQALYDFCFSESVGRVE